MLMSEEEQQDWKEPEKKREAFLQ
eukprot:gene26445-biopygen16487